MFDVETSAGDAHEPEPPGPQSLLGIPVRLLLAVASIGLPLIAVAWFSATHTWPPPPACGAFAVFGCPSAPYPTEAHAIDWLNLAGPVLGLASAVLAIGLVKEDVEGALTIVLFRYLTPLIGIVVSIGCAAQLSEWIHH